MEEIFWRTMCRTDGIRLESQLCSTLHEHCLCCNTTLCGFLLFLNYLGDCCPKCPSTGTKLFQKHPSYACLNAPCIAKQVVPSRLPCESSNHIISGPCLQQEGPLISLLLSILLWNWFLINLCFINHRTAHALNNQRIKTVFSNFRLCDRCWFPSIVSHYLCTFKYAHKGHRI